MPIASIEAQSSGGRGNLNELQTEDCTQDSDGIHLIELTRIPLTDEKDFQPRELDSEDNISENIPTNSSRILEIWHSIGGLLMILCATLVFSGMTTLTKLAGKEGIPTMQIVLLRSIVMWILVALFTIGYLKQSPFGPKKLYPILALRGFLGCCGLSAATAAILRLSLSESLSIIFTNPIITSAFAVVFLHEKWELFDGLVSLLAFVGVLFVARPSAIFGMELGAPISESQSESERLLFVGVAFAGAIFIAAAYVTIRKIGKRTHAFVIVGYFSFASMLVAPIGFIFEPFVMPSVSGWVYTVFVGVMAFLGQSFLSLGLQMEQASKASNVMYLQIPLAFFWDVAVFNASLSILGVVGALCILFAAFITGFRRWRKNAARQRSLASAYSMEEKEGDKKTDHVCTSAIGQIEMTADTTVNA